MLPVARKPDQRQWQTGGTSAATAPARRIDTAVASDDGRYRAARRHSRLVGALRVLLPVIAVAATGGFLATAYVGSSIPRVSFGGIDLKSNSLVMDNPHVSGFSGSRQSYKLSADRAVQNLKNPQVVTLEGIDARLGLEAGDAAALGAGRGIYDSGAETLSYATDHRQTSTRCEAGQSRRVDLKKGTLQQPTS
jgi:lipopolysaccharide export system protein LptC